MADIFVGEYFSALRVDLKELQIPNEITEPRDSIRMDENRNLKWRLQRYLIIWAGTGSTRMSELNSITGPVYSLQQQALVANTAEEFHTDQAWDKFIQLGGKYI